VRGGDCVDVGGGWRLETVVELQIKAAGARGAITLQTAYRYIEYRYIGRLHMYGPTPHALGHDHKLLAQRPKRP